MNIPDEQVAQARYRVLVVDDEPAHRMLEREILSGAGMTVDEAASAEDALASLRTRDYDAVLVDKFLPGMNGDELCHAIRHDIRRPFLPPIMVTGSGRHEQMARSMSMGATDYLNKPYHPVELLARTFSAVRFKRATDQLDSAESVLFALARMVEARDGETGDHCSRLAHASVVFARSLGLDEVSQESLRRAGVLHDIGKLAIPDSILLKPASLTEAEWAIMRQHTVIGAALVSELRSMSAVQPIIRHHHERWDGSGYPDGLAGEAIPYLAQVFQLVDIHDALANPRPYKSAWSFDRIRAAFEEEAQRGWRNPDLVEKFLRLLRADPEALTLTSADSTEGGLAVYRQVIRALGTDRMAEHVAAV